MTIHILEIKCFQGQTWSNMTATKRALLDLDLAIIRVATVLDRVQMIRKGRQKFS